MHLIAHELTDAEFWPVRPASPRRDWMDATPSRFAYRCLPLSMANHAGWIVESPASFIATWDGTQDAPHNIDLAFAPGDERHAHLISSHFGSGILTFAIPYLFRTEDGVGLLVRGLPNQPKPGAFALEGFVETDWSPFSFTMNWQLLEPHRPVVFEKGEPICFLQPFAPALLNDRPAEFRSLHSDPQLFEEFEAWRTARRAFNEDTERKARWQKDYHRGQTVEGRRVPTHLTAFRVRTFESAPGNGAALADARTVPPAEEVIVQPPAPDASGDTVPDVTAPGGIPRGCPMHRLDGPAPGGDGPST